MFNIEHQKNVLKSTIAELESVGVPITGVYMPTSDTDAGVEIDGKYILQIADYCAPGLFLDSLSGEEITEFKSTGDLITFLMEN